MTRILNVPGERFSLADLGEDWTDCYVTYRPATVGDMVELKKMQGVDPQKDADQVSAFMVDFVREHFLSGKVSVLEDDKPQVVSMTVADVGTLPTETMLDLFSGITGGSTDPKDSPKEVPASSVPSSASAPSETPSSTASRQTSQPTSSPS